MGYVFYVYSLQQCTIDFSLWPREYIVYVSLKHYCRCGKAALVAPSPFLSGFGLDSVASSMLTWDRNLHVYFSLFFDGKIRDVSILRNWYRMIQMASSQSYLYWSVGSARGFPVHFRSALAYASLLPLFHIWLHYIVCTSCHAALPLVAHAPKYMYGLGGASGCEKVFVNIFLRGPQAIGLYHNSRAAEAGNGTSRKHFTKLFSQPDAPSCILRTERTHEGVEMSNGHWAVLFWIATTASFRQ